MNRQDLFNKATELKLYGLLEHFDEIVESDWLPNILRWEEEERTHRSRERRLRSAHIGNFKPLANFDWNWPKQCNKQAILECMGLEFIKENTNIIFCGPNGVGKSTIAQNLAYQAALEGNSVLFSTAARMLNDLASQDGDNLLRRKTKYYVQPNLLVIDEVGYLSYSDRHADLLFSIISARYQKKSTIITTNKPFSEWSEIFPNAGCVVSMIDRLIHNSEIINIEADSYRLKEANEKNAFREAKRRSKTSN